MTGPAAATAHWRALDREGEDRCRLSRAGDGWLLVGHARFRDARGFAALDYVVRCDAGWQTLGADIAGDHDGRKVQIRIQRAGADWTLDETAQPGLHPATDLDLCFSPATKLMPLRRLMAAPGDQLDICAAWLRYPDPALACRVQSYARTDRSDVFAYRARQTGYACEMTVDASGFITLFPGLWEGEVRHAD